MIKITRFFYVHWLFFPLLFLAWAVRSLNTMFMAYSIVCVHELFHLFAALIVKERIGSVILLPFGMTLRLSARVIRHTGKEIFIALAGPFSNLLMLLVGRLVESFFSVTPLSLWMFQVLNLSVLGLNLLPCLPLDGGRVLKAILIRRLGYLDAISMMRKIGKVLTILIFLAGLFLLFLSRFNVSLLMVASFLVLHMTEEQRRNEYIIMQELLYAKNKLKKRGLMRSDSVTVIDSVHAKDVFRLLAYDRYYVVHIVDSQQKFLRSITEAQMVEAIMQKGWHTCFKEIW